MMPVERTPVELRAGAPTGVGDRWAGPPSARRWRDRPPGDARQARPGGDGLPSPLEGVPGLPAEEEAVAARVLAGQPGAGRAAAVWASVPGRSVGEHRRHALLGEHADVARAEAVRSSDRVEPDAVAGRVDDAAAANRFRGRRDEPGCDAALEQRWHARAAEVAADDVPRRCLEVAARAGERRRRPGEPEQRRAERSDQRTHLEIVVAGHPGGRLRRGRPATSPGRGRRWPGSSVRAAF